MLKIIYILVILYIALLTLMFVFQRKLLYFPTPLSEYQMGNSAPFTILEITTNDGLSLRSWQSKGDPEKKTFIFFHGNAGNAADRMPAMEVLLKAGHSVVLAEYRGYGGNPGKPSEDKLNMDARRLMGEIIKQGVNVRDIILMGRSLGTGVATFLAAEYDVAALVLISAYSSLPEVASEHYPFFPVSLLMRDRFNNLDRIANITAPLLIFHGEMDQIIPLPYGLKVYDAAQGEKEFIRLPGLGHNNLDMNQINHHILKQL
ncbi:MAG: alpha/beta hydrolase [Emcibacter sp.]|nr:alpha/beta hydrolase [Emcibacter sp.]